MAIRTLTASFPRASDPTPISTSDQTSVTYDGVTFTFDRAMPVGAFVTGEPFVVSDEAFAITGITPASSDLASDGHVGNGAMKDPYITTQQGFDSYIGAGTDSSITAANTPYSAGLNIDPAIGGNIAISLGEETTIVKSVRKASGTGINVWQNIDRYVELHVLSSSPAVGSYPPSASETGSKTIYNKNNIDQSVLRSITFPASFTDTYAYLRANVADQIALYGDGPISDETRRRFKLDSQFAYTNNNYAGQYTKGYMKLVMWLHNAAATSGQKEEIIDLIVRYAIQLKGLQGRGWKYMGATWSLAGGAGQYGNIYTHLMYAGFLLQEPSFITAAQESAVEVTRNSKIMAAGDVGTLGTENSGANAQPIETVDIGQPFVLPGNDRGSNDDSRYGNIAMQTNAYELLACQMLQGGPSGESGRSAILAGGAENSSNPRYACLAFLDRYRTFVPFVYYDSYNPGPEWFDLYDTLHGILSWTKWTGTPTQFPFGGDMELAYRNDFTDGTADIITAGTGTINWDWDGWNYAQPVATQLDAGYSIDGKQWVTVANVGYASDFATEGHALLRGQEHYVRFRQVNANGAGRWTYNYPWAYASYTGWRLLPRGVITTTGTATAAAPTNTVTPAIVALKQPQWRGSGDDYARWEETGASISVDEVTLAAGLGYWTGYPAPTYAFQWQESADGSTGWTDITVANGYATNANAQVFQRKAENAGQYLRCKIDATNASGTTTAYTSVSQCPAIQNPPAGYLIQTDFTETFLVDYETEWNAISVSNCTKALDGGKTFDTDLDYTFGALIGDKTGGNPNMTIPMSRSFVAGTTYDINMVLFADTPWSFAGNTLKFDVRRQTAGTSYLTGASGTQPVAFNAESAGSYSDTFTGGSYAATVTASDGSYPFKIELTITVVVGGGESDLDPEILILNNTGTGLTNGGDIEITSLEILPAA